MRERCRVALLVVALAMGGTVSVRAQDTTVVAVPVSPAPVPTVPAADSADSAVRRAPGPLGALWRSFLVPGWGQARFNRKLTGGIFVAWEGVTLGMTLKTRHELGYLRRTNSRRGDAKRQEHEDWLVLLAFNHLFSGLEAYVSAHLADFPDDLQIRALPGGAAATYTMPFRLR